MPFVKFAKSDVLEARLARSGDGLLKSAHKATFDYTPREGYLYVRSRAISSRTNDNFDSWPADELRQAWATFVGKPVFVNHHNDDVRRKRGVIIDAALHEDISPDGLPDVWIEVLMEIDAIRFPKLAAAILAGDIERTSMGADVGESVCSYCGNVATTPSTYCSHIKSRKGQRLLRRNPDGTSEEVLVHEECRKISFFENSVLVEPPADPTAFFLGVDDSGVRSLGMEAKTAARMPERRPGLPRAFDSDEESYDDYLLKVSPGTAILGGKYNVVTNGDRTEFYARDDVYMIGFLTLKPGTKIIDEVHVDDGYRREGIATAMFEVAQKFHGGKLTFPGLDELTPNGLAWSRAMGRQPASGEMPGARWNPLTAGYEASASGFLVAAAKRRKAARGFPCDIGAVELGRKALEIYRRMEDKTATADDILAIAAGHGRVGNQWGIEDSEYGSNWADDGASEYAYTDHGELAKNWVAENCGSDATDEEIWEELQDNLGEVMVILVGTTTAEYVDAVWDAAIPQMSKINLTEVRYDAGWGWVKLPTTKTVFAKKDTTPSEEKGNTTDRGYGWDHQKKRDELLKDNPKCHWCKDKKATEADHYNNGLVPSCSACNNARSHEQKKKNSKESTMAKSKRQWREATKKTDGGIPKKALTQAEADGLLAGLDERYQRALEKFVPYTVYGPGYSRGITTNLMDAIRAARQRDERSFAYLWSKCEAGYDIEVAGGDDNWFYDSDMGQYTKRLVSKTASAITWSDDPTSLTATKDGFTVNQIAYDGQHALIVFGDPGEVFHWTVEDRNNSDYVADGQAMTEDRAKSDAEEAHLNASGGQLGMFGSKTAGEYDYGPTEPGRMAGTRWEGILSLPNSRAYQVTVMWPGDEVSLLSGVFNSEERAQEWAQMCVAAGGRSVLIENAGTFQRASTKTAASSYTMISPGVTTWFELHRTGCSDLSHPKYQLVSRDKIDAASPKEAAEYWLDPFIEQGQGYTMDDVKIFPCCSSSAPAPKATDPNACSASGTPVIGLGRNLRGNCPECGKFLSVGRGTWPKHAPLQKRGSASTEAGAMIQEFREGSYGFEVWKNHSKDDYATKFPLFSWKGDYVCTVVAWNEQHGLGSEILDGFGSTPEAAIADAKRQIAEWNLSRKAAITAQGVCQRCHERKTIVGSGVICQDCLDAVDRGEPMYDDERRSATVKTAYGETKAPPKVNTLGVTECPVCASTNQFDSSGRCTTCGHLPAPEPFREPDLDVAQKVDMRDGWVNPELLAAPAFVPPADAAADDSMNPVQSDMSTHQEVEGPEGDTMRPSAALIAQQQAQLQRLASENEALRRRAGLARRTADADNPAQPVEEPAPGAASQTTEQARAADAATDLTSPGGAVITDMGAAATTDVTAPGGAVLTNVAPSAGTTEVTTPVAGTTEMVPYDQSVTLVQPDASGAANGTDKTNAFAQDNSWVQSAEATRARTYACLRLARLRLQAGIAQGDDLVIAQRIEASERPSDSALRSEITALAAVVQKQASAAPRRREATRGVPSLASNVAPSIGFERTAGFAIDSDEVLW